MFDVSAVATVVATVSVVVGVIFTVLELRYYGSLLNQSDVQLLAFRPATS